MWITRDSKRWFYVPDTMKGLLPYQRDAYMAYVSGLGRRLLKGI